MKSYLKLSIASLALCAVFLIGSGSADAAVNPVPNVDVLLKSVETLRVLVATTDDQGNFKMIVPETGGVFYNVFIGDENTPPVRVEAKDNIITGRIVILTDDTPAPDISAPTVVSTPAVKAAVSVVKKPAPVPSTVSAISPKSSVWQ